jgi:hypothetical protein
MVSGKDDEDDEKPRGPLRLIVSSPELPVLT